MAKTVILKNTEGSGTQTGEELKAKVLSIINPRTEKMKIKGVRKTRDGGLVLEMATQSDIDKIMDHDALRKEGIKATIAGASNPKLVIFDAPRNLTEDELVETIYNQNEDLLDQVTKEEFTNNFKPRFRIGKRLVESTNWVVEVSPKIRTILRDSDKIRLYIEWRACKIQDFRGVSRCFNCQCYGHVAKFCREKEKTCTFCANSGHMAIDCPEQKAGKPPKCPTCKRAKKKADHLASDKACPAYKAALERVISRTDYGTSNDT